MIRIDFRSLPSPQFLLSLSTLTPVALGRPYITELPSHSCMPILLAVLHIQMLFYIPSFVGYCCKVPSFDDSGLKWMNQSARFAIYGDIAIMV